MTGWQVVPRVVNPYDLSKGVTRQWCVSLGGYTYYVEEHNGKLTCSCALKTGCVHLKAVEEQCIREHAGKTPTPKTAAASV